MKSFEYKSISPTDFRVYEARAHQLRSQAAHDGSRAIAAFLKSKIQALGAMIIHRRHA